MLDLKIVKKNVRDLRSHPFQSAFYSDCSARDDKALAADLKARGQQTPIVVMPAKNAAGLPAFTILDGHRRLQALESIGVAKVDVVVRHDLKTADASAVEAEFLKYNFQRRQLHPLDKSRVGKRLYEIEKNRAPGELRRHEKAALRDRIGKILNMSGRNLERYLHVLDTPLPVQNAVRDGRLRLVAGAKIAMLPKDQQKEIAQRMDGVNDPKEIAEIIGNAVAVPDGRRHQKVGDAVATFVRSLERSKVDLGDRVGNVSPRLAARYQPVLTDAAKMISQLLQLARSA